MKIDFDEEKHEYSVNGVKIPSVSEILAPLSAERYSELNPWMVKAAAARGTAIHEACELIDYGCEPDEDPDIDGYLVAYQSFLLDHDVKWSMIERIVYYNRAENELPLYCGTVDRYGLIDGVPTLVDIKTYASLSTDAQLAASCQTILYLDAIEEVAERYLADEFIESIGSQHRAILHLRKDGTYRLVDLGEWDNKHGFNSRDTAWMLFNVWANKDAAKKTNKRGKNNGK